MTSTEYVTTTMTSPQAANAIDQHPRQGRAAHEHQRSHHQSHDITVTYEPISPRKLQLGDRQLSLRCMGHELSDEWMVVVAEKGSNCWALAFDESSAFEDTMLDAALIANDCAGHNEKRRSKQVQSQLKKLTSQYEATLHGLII